jgi:hypothetical protein
MESPQHPREPFFPPARTASSQRTLERVPLGPVVLLVVGLVVFGLVLLLRHGSSRNAALPPVGVPAAVSESQLLALAKQTDHPIYWAGPKSGAYELTRTTDGRIYVRYLPSAAKVGDGAPRYLTIGTYLTKDAFGALTAPAEHHGVVSAKLDRHGLLVFNERTPTNVYFSYPHAGYQVEVFDPSAAEARTLVLSNKITPLK